VCYSFADESFMNLRAHSSKTDWLSFLVSITQRIIPETVMSMWYRGTLKIDQSLLSHTFASGFLHIRLVHLGTVEVVAIHHGNRFLTAKLQAV
jgi:hypothetical protein